MFVVTVMYPSNTKFDLKYYMATHMPLVDARWKEHGLKSWSVTRATGAPAGEAPFQIITTLNFDSGDGFQKAVAASGKEVMGDVPNFTDAQPTMQFGEPVTA
jgi:uncharacterized protein (TIGR02118 family)